MFWSNTNEIALILHPGNGESCLHEVDLVISAVRGFCVARAIPLSQKAAIEAAVNKFLLHWERLNCAVL